MIRDLRRFAVRQGDDRRRHPELRGLAHQQRRALRVAGDHQHVGAHRLDLEERRGHVVEIARQLVVDHDLHAVPGRVGDHAGADVLRERIVLDRDRDPQRGRVLRSRRRLLGREVDRLLQVLIGGGQHGEQVAVALVEQGQRRAVALHHRHLVLLGDRRDRLRQARAVRAEHERDPVLPDQALGQLGAARRRRFVVVVQDLQAVVLARDLNAAALVDLLDREVVAVARVVAGGRVLAGQRYRRAEHDGVAGDPGERGSGRRQQGRAKQQRQDAPRARTSAPDSEPLRFVRGLRHVSTLDRERPHVKGGRPRGRGREKRLRTSPPRRPVRRGGSVSGSLRSRSAGRRSGCDGRMPGSSPAGSASRRPRSPGT